MSGVGVVRVLVGVLGAVLLAGGILVAIVVPAAFVGGFFMIISGVVLLIGVVIERSRYRSQEAERTQASPGPGGGETGPIEPRFQRTDEVFVDPTTHLRMRVFHDPRTGERRYVAEG